MCSEPVSHLAGFFVMINQTFAFDVYGTLINTEGVLELLGEFMAEKAAQFSAQWRNKQLEYSFRRGLMDRYVDFSICTREALLFTCAATKTHLTDDQINRLMHSYKTLPAFTDVSACLSSLKKEGHRIYAFSNGSQEAIHDLLQRAKLFHYFDGTVSMASIRTFKPNPMGYQHFIDSAQSEKSTSWLVSGNSFDVIGAAAYGMRTIWLRRKENMVLDPMGYTPTLVVKSLLELPRQIEQFLLP